MSNRSANLILPLFLIAIGFGLVFFLSNYIEKNRPVLPEDFSDQDLLLHGAKLKGYTLGYNGLIADWYWMQSLPIYWRQGY